MLILKGEEVLFFFSFIDIHPMTICQGQDQRLLRHLESELLEEPLVLARVVSVE